MNPLTANIVTRESRGTVYMCRCVYTQSRASLLLCIVCTSLQDQRLCNNHGSTLYSQLRRMLLGMSIMN